jgi:hypothetical protein
MNQDPGAQQMQDAFSKAAAAFQSSGGGAGTVMPE